MIITPRLVVTARELWVGVDRGATTRFDTPMALVTLRPRGVVLRLVAGTLAQLCAPGNGV
jgi:hypothetical protein